MQTSTKATTAATTPAADSYVTTLLRGVLEGKRVVRVAKGETIFSQGDRADSIYFIQAGGVKVSVLSPAGKAGVLALLGPHSFFGEDSLMGKSARASTVTALEPSTLFRVESRAMRQALLTQSELSQRFMSLLLTRSIDMEEDLADQLFNHSEKRLARVLLKLAHARRIEGVLDGTIPRLSHETLSEIVGTTRSRVTRFMNKFKTMGLIQYSDRKGHRIEPKVKTERLTDLVLQD